MLANAYFYLTAQALPCAALKLPGTRPARHVVDPCADTTPVRLSARERGDVDKAKAYEGIAKVGVHHQCKICGSIVGNTRLHARKGGHVQRIASKCFFRKQYGNCESNRTTH